MSAFGRAFHAENAKEPIFNDTKAKELMTPEEYESIGRYILGGIDFFAPERKGTFADDAETLRYLVNTQIAPTPVARARYCEESLLTSVRTGTEQYVILGAGLDTFAFRMPEFAKKYKVYEVDHPLTQQDKKERIRRAGWALPEKLCFVPCDFTNDSLYEKLTEHGFDSSKKTFFSWLGVSMYLCREDIEKFLSEIASFACDGSTLLFDYASCGLFLSDVKRAQNMIAMAKAGGEELKSGFNMLALELMLSDHGFLCYEHLCSDDIQRRFFAGKADGLTAFEDINYVQAVYKKAGQIKPENIGNLN